MVCIHAISKQTSALLQDYIDQTSRTQAISFSSSRTTPRLGLGSEQTNLHSSQTKKPERATKTVGFRFQTRCFFSCASQWQIGRSVSRMDPNRVELCLRFCRLSKSTNFRKPSSSSSLLWGCRNTRSSCEISISHICQGNNMGKWVV